MYLTKPLNSIKTVLNPNTCNPITGVIDSAYPIELIHLHLTRKLLKKPINLLSEQIEVGMRPNQSAGP